MTQPSRPDNSSHTPRFRVVVFDASPDRAPSLASDFLSHGASAAEWIDDRAALERHISDTLDRGGPPWELMVIGWSASDEDTASLVRTVRSLAGFDTLPIIALRDPSVDCDEKMLIRSGLTATVPCAPDPGLASPVQSVMRVWGPIRRTDNSPLTSPG